MALNERVGAAAASNRHFQNVETPATTWPKDCQTTATSLQLYAAEATVITLALNYYQHMGPVHHDVIVITLIQCPACRRLRVKTLRTLLFAISWTSFGCWTTKAHIRFCWIPSHCGIDGNERGDQLAKESLDHDIDPLVGFHYADLKPQVNSYIQQLVQIKWDVAVHDRDLYFVKPTLGPPKKFQHLTRAEEVVITRLRIGHTKATKSHILSRGPPTVCHHCGQRLTIDHMLLECALLQECRGD